MPRPFKTDRPCRVEFKLPESIFAKLQLELWSELENRVPQGRISELFTELTVKWLREQGRD